MDTTLFWFLVLCSGILIVVLGGGWLFFIRAVRAVGRAWRGK